MRASLLLFQCHRRAPAHYLRHRLSYSLCIRDAKEAFSVRPRFPEHFRYMVLDVEDNEDQNLIRLFPGCVPLFACLIFSAL